MRPQSYPLAALPAPAKRRDHQLLAASLDALAALEPLPEHVSVHLDAGYDYMPCRGGPVLDLLEEITFDEVDDDEEWDDEV